MGTVQSDGVRQLGRWWWDWEVCRIISSICHDVHLGHVGKKDPMCLTLFGPGMVWSRGGWGEAVHVAKRVIKMNQNGVEVSDNQWGEVVEKPGQGQTMENSPCLSLSSLDGMQCLPKGSKVTPPLPQTVSGLRALAPNRPQTDRGTMPHYCLIRGDPCWVSGTEPWNLSDPRLRKLCKHPG